jgi:UDP-2,4-diacetamido-2,4,6-trideoxy-beta-L-altropyranose hydrolase
VGHPIVLVADAGREAGLGHISRSTAVAVALRAVGLETRCYAYGAQQPFRRDGIDWAPLEGPDPPAAHVLVIDSYRLPQETLTAAARATRLVLMHDVGSVPAETALVVSAAGPPRDDPAWLGGFAYAPLRPGFWELPPRYVEPTVRRVLVTTGGGQFAPLGGEVAQAVAAELPESDVTVVSGPHGAIEPSARINVLTAPDSLLSPLLVADLVVTAAGQTMLEAVASGAPSVALPLVENQRRQAVRLAEAGAVRLVDPPTVRSAAAAAGELARDAKARRSLSRAAQNAVDGYGAMRVAFAIGRLAGGPS